ncbi:MAG TPA: hypothetical protein VFO16_14930 [Pseudonocardiaceae bacterium]|nr:hypothetical protein [Pseudonocardiaceae bacterium]
MDAGCSLGGRGRKDQTANEGRPDQGDLLCDEAADGEPEDVGLAEPHGGDECDCVMCHVLDEVRRCSGGTADPSVVEGEDAPGRG